MVPASAYNPGFTGLLTGGVKWAYIVAYDLNSPEAKYQSLFTELQKSITWWHYLNSVWIVVRTETLVDLNKKLLPLIFQRDRLLVMPAKGPGDGWLQKEAWDWINVNLTKEW